MKYALYLGCTIQTEQMGYEISVRKVLPRLGVELVDMVGTSCCGFPGFSSLSVLAWSYLSARNLALAEDLGLDVLPLCNGCFYSLTRVQRDLDETPDMKDVINGYLAKEGLEYSGTSKVLHVIDLLHDIVGLDRIRGAVQNPLSDMKLAAHLGCHAFRPRSYGSNEKDRSLEYEKLIAALGADYRDYSQKDDCCGSSLAMTSGRATLLIAGEKLSTVRQQGFEALVTTCPFCFRVFDSRQRAIRSLVKDDSLQLPVFYYSQLLGLALGLPEEALGLQLNQSPVEGVLKRLRDQR